MSWALLKWSVSERWEGNRVRRSVTVGGTVVGGTAPTGGSIFLFLDMLKSKKVYLFKLTRFFFNYIFFTVFVTEIEPWE